MDELMFMGSITVVGAATTVALQASRTDHKIRDGRLYSLEQKERDIFIEQNGIELPVLSLSTDCSSNTRVTRTALNRAHTSCNAADVAKKLLINECRVTHANGVCLGPS